MVKIIQKPVHFWASEAQIKSRENFVKNYAKKKGSKSTKSNRKKDKKKAKSGNKTDIRLRKLEKKSVDVKKLKKYSKSAKDEYDKLYAQDRKDWKRLKALGKKRGW